VSRVLLTTVLLSCNDYEQVIVHTLTNTCASVIKQYRA